MHKSFRWPALLHACYRRSRAQTAVLLAMLGVHQLLRTWEKMVDVFLVATDFYRRKFSEAGLRLPGHKIAVVPHFVEDYGTKTSGHRYALFVGRLDPEKGVRTLLNAWRKLRNVPLRIRGDGPLMTEAERLAASSAGSVQLVPRLRREQLIGLMQGARFLVWPSEGYYETFGYVAVEAFSCGIPVIASRVGVAEEIVQEGQTGIHFTGGDPDDLASKVEWAWTHPREMAAMGREARAEYETKYTPERSYAMLTEIYQRVIETHRAR